MSPHVVLVEEWPQPDTVNAAIVIANGSRLMVCYGTGEDEFVVLTFPLSTELKAGGPNDEALDGHSLYRFGLRPYSIHRIESSPWLHELERRNSVHPRHDAKQFLRDKVHYLFAFKEETVECVVTEHDTSQVQIEVFESRQRALEYVRGRIDA